MKTHSGILPATIAACVTFAVYFMTVAPTIQPGDAGELAAAACSLGITHPTGYPLFTLLEYVICQIPWGSAAWRLNLSMAVFCALAVFFFCLAFIELLNGKSYKTPHMSSEKTGDPRQESNMDWIISAGIALTLAFSKTFWGQAISLEVYGLHLLLTSISFWIFLKFIHGEPQETRTLRWGYGFAFVLGLSFSNHLTTILWVPGLLFLFFSTRKIQSYTWKFLFKLSLCFLGGLTPYLYLPLRALQNPLHNWGDPSTWDRFWRHLTGAQFETLMFSSSEVARSNLWRYIESIGGEFGPIFMVLVAGGLVAQFLKAKKILVLTLTLFATCVFYAINYNIPDIEAYFLLANIALAISALYGLRAVVEFCRRKIAPWFAFAVCGFLPVVPLAYHFGDLDRSKDYVVDDYSRNVFNSVDSGAVLFSDEEQDFLFPAQYLQTVERLRPDVTVVDIHLLRMSWHLKYMKQAHPQVLSGSASELTAYAQALQHAESYGFGHATSAEMNTARLISDKLWGELVRALLLNNLKERPVYATTSLAVRGKAGLDLNSGVEKLPSGLTFRYFLPGTSTRIPYRLFTFHPLPTQNPRTASVRSYYATGYSNQGLYYGLLLGDTATGIDLIKKSLALDPSAPAAHAGLRQLGAVP